MLKFENKGSKPILSVVIIQKVIEAKNAFLTHKGRTTFSYPIA
jgi:hypothetical protein